MGVCRRRRRRLAKPQGPSALPTRTGTRSSQGMEKKTDRHRLRQRPLGQRKPPGCSPRRTQCEGKPRRDRRHRPRHSSHAAPQVPQNQVATNGHHRPSTAGAHRHHRPRRVSFATSTGVPTSQRPSQHLPVRQHGGRYCPSADSNTHSNTQRAPPPPTQRGYDGDCGKLWQERTQAGGGGGVRARGNAIQNSRERRPRQAAATRKLAGDPATPHPASSPRTGAGAREHPPHPR